MSLKAFHIVFVTLSTMLAAGFGVWALRRAAERGPVYTAIGVGALLFGGAMVLYGRWFLRKLKHASYL
ncbi:MAG: hypothetical protein ACE5E6_01280 [Phycisphaerae bacterium]